MPLRPMLERIYSIALDMYLSGKDGPRGCFTVMTATSEAVFDPAIREMVISGLVETDRFFGRIFKRAQERGELAGVSRSAGAGASSPPPRSTPLPSAPAPKCRGRNSMPSSRARSM